MNTIVHIQSISQLHTMLGYAKPRHPLITVIDYTDLVANADHYGVRMMTDFYIISLKTPAPKSLLYGRHYYDFEEGTMMFIGPGQVFSIGEPDEQASHQGWGLYFHPDLILNTPLVRKIREHTFFSYAVSEALHLSDDEKTTLSSIINLLKKEYSGNIDYYSQSVMSTAIEQLLNYASRFYGRQFITRTKLNSDVVSTFEQLVNEYFALNQTAELGHASVEYFASKLNLSPSYLTDLLKKETGKTTKEHVQIQLIEQAKYRLLNSNDTVNEIAYLLGFEYPQYFNRLFKAKTGRTPAAYRSLN